METNSDSDEITLGISKFNNIKGVTCYMNSILAILQQTPIFADYILSTQFKSTLLKHYPDTNKLVDSPMYQLYNLLKLSAESDSYNITPSSFRQAITKKDDMWGMSQHQDSQEFLTFLLSQLENEVSEKVEFIPGLNLTNIKPLNQSIIQILANSMWQRFIKNEYSLIKTLFTGMTRMTTTCALCGDQSNNFDIFQTLQLSIPVNHGSEMFKKFTLDECLNHYTSEERLDKDNMMTCNFCYRKNRSNKKTFLWKTPKVLIIHIKRFLVNSFGIPTQKLNNLIEYPNELDIGKYVDMLSPDFNEKTKYNLFSVNCHHSLSGGLINTINYGHYTSLVRNRYDNKWYRFDDNSVSSIKNTVDKNAYMLFYYLTN